MQQQQNDMTGTVPESPPPITTVTKALQMPELLLHIGSHLTSPTLIRCFLVCRTWHHLLKPLLWHTFEFPAPEPMFGSSLTKRQPSPDQVRRMASWIQRLIFYKDPKSIRSSSFEYFITALLIPDNHDNKDKEDDGGDGNRDHLTRLDVFFTIPEVDRLLQQNQGSLRRLRITSNMYHPAIAYLARGVLTERILGMSRLEELSLMRFHISQGPQGSAFLQTLPRLRVLELGMVKLDAYVPGQEAQDEGQGQEHGQAYGSNSNSNSSNNDSNTSFVLPRIRKLKLDRVLVEGQQLMNLWKACTHVEDLTWIWTRLPHCVDFPTAKVCDHLARPSSLSMIQSLSRLELNAKTVTDEEFSRLLGLLPNLRGLVVNNTRFGPLALATLLGDDVEGNESRRQGRRARGWRELSFVNCMWLTGWDTQRILTSCSSLEVFAGSPIYISQITSRQNLFAIINSSTPSESLSTTPFRTLPHEQDEVPLQDRPWVCSASLEYLDVRFLLCTEDENRTSTVPSRNSDTMRLRKGIIYDRLASLQKLQVLSLSNNDGIIISPTVIRYEEESGTRRAYGLDFCLRYEMARLAPLKRLRELRLHRLENDLQMGEEEFLWLEREFLDLVAILGPFDEGLVGGKSYRFYLGRG
ncbi:hypothetical protein BG015_004924 [Linnemannia schmuckeri]|uniref:F-box domain-containing protein n=1 Tax=Linnemannia schmuckeri TaxID=64567 RepID=A0A9P5VCL1_9FUNG|nr:hypothetical protein BG015_004924 [Linnemannia schmuckeri]